MFPVPLDCPFLSCLVGALWRLFDIPNTQIQDRILFWLGTDTSVINGRINRGYGPLVVTTALLSYFTTHQWMFNKSDTTGDTNETGNAVLSKTHPCFCFVSFFRIIRVIQSLFLCVVFCWQLFVLFPFPVVFFYYPVWNLQTFLNLCFILNRVLEGKKS